MWIRSSVWTYSLNASVVIRNEGEEFLSEKGDQRGGSLWKSQHLLQHRQHALPAKTHGTISLNKNPSLRFSPPLPAAQCCSLLHLPPSSLVSRHPMRWMSCWEMNSLVMTSSSWLKSALCSSERTGTAFRYLQRSAQEAVRENSSQSRPTVQLDTQ